MSPAIADGIVVYKIPYRRVLGLVRARAKVSCKQRESPPCPPVTWALKHALAATLTLVHVHARSKFYLDTNFIKLARF